MISNEYDIQHRDTTSTCRVVGSKGHIRIHNSYYGNLHRLNGPAAIYWHGIVEYWVDGNLHRTDGPAVIDSDGNKEYWVDHIEMSSEEFFLKYGTV